MWYCTGKQCDAVWCSVTDHRHWRTFPFVCKCFILPYLLKFRDVHRTGVVTGANLSTCDVPRTKKTATYPHTRWDVQVWQRMSQNLLHRRNFSNCLQCFDCPRILDLHCYLLELIMSSSVMKDAFIMSLLFIACYTEVTEAIWSSLWRHSLNRLLYGVTLKLSIFTQPRFACLSLVLKHVGQLKFKI
jgi:hypothetical protein